MSYTTTGYVRCHELINSWETDGTYHLLGWSRATPHFRLLSRGYDVSAIGLGGRVGSSMRKCSGQNLAILTKKSSKRTYCNYLKMNKVATTIDHTPRCCMSSCFFVVLFVEVPVLTLRWQSGTCDVTIGNCLGIYKSQLLREQLGEESQKWRVFDVFCVFCEFKNMWNSMCCFSF